MEVKGNAAGKILRLLAQPLGHYERLNPSNIASLDLLFLFFLPLFFEDAHPGLPFLLFTFCNVVGFPNWMLSRPVWKVNTLSTNTRMTPFQIEDTSRSDIDGGARRGGVVEVPASGVTMQSNGFHKLKLVKVHDLYKPASGFSLKSMGG